MFIHSNLHGFRQYKDWYRNTRSTLIKVFGKDYKLVAALISATSPRQQVRKNIKIAINIYKQYKTNPDFQSFFSDKTNFLKHYGLMNSHYNNIRTALNHNYNKPLVLSGHKVNAFYNNMVGNYYHVTLDIWMLRLLGLNDVEIKQTAKSKRLYIDRSNVIIEAAKEVNLLPAELQSVLWIKYKNEVGNNNKTFVPVGFSQYIVQFAA